MASVTITRSRGRRRTGDAAHSFLFVAAASGPICNPADAVPLPGWLDELLDGALAPELRLAEALVPLQAIVGPA